MYVYKTDLAFCRTNGLYVKHGNSSIKNNHCEEGFLLRIEEKEREAKMFSKRRVRSSPLFLFLVKFLSSDSLFVCFKILLHLPSEL